MSGADWLSYSLQDFVMFGPLVFLRLFSRINSDLWPWLLLAVLASLVIPFLLVRREQAWRRLGMALVAAGWIASGYGFLVGYFGPINWPASGFGWAFVGQGAVLLALVLAGGMDSRPVRAFPLIVLWLMAVAGLVWIPVLAGGGWQALAVFGVGPWVTAAAASLAAALLKTPWRWLYLALPIVWSLFSAAMFWALNTPWFLVSAAATPFMLVAALRLSPRPARNPG